MNRERTAMLENLMEKAVHPDNWEAALCAVERNKGAAGPDGMAASELRAHLVTHGSVIAGGQPSARCREAPGHPKAQRRHPPAEHP